VTDARSQAIARRRTKKKHDRFINKQTYAEPGVGAPWKEQAISPDWRAFVRSDDFAIGTIVEPPTHRP
jgi:hypothetical protein